MPFSKSNFDTSRSQINFNFCTNGILEKKQFTKKLEPVKNVFSPPNPPLVLHENNRSIFFYNFFANDESEKSSGNIVFDKMGNFFSKGQIKKDEQLILKSFVPKSDGKTVLEGEKGVALARFEKSKSHPFIPIPGTDGNFSTNGSFFAIKNIGKNSFIFNINTFGDEIKPVDKMCAVFNTFLIEENIILPFFFNKS